MRKVVHFLDNRALSPQRVKAFYCISETVKNRKEYFPPGVEPTVIHPPSSLPRFENNGYRTIFTISRLDHPKRVELLVRAMKYVKADIPLMIGGDGPQENYLRGLTAGDDRVKFLGFLNDEETIKHYADALVVPYVPDREDYGLVTIEAMMSRKPVITCVDSGGPTEFVVDGQNGFVVEPDPAAIAQKIDLLAFDTNMAEELGARGFEKVKDITWENTVQRLLEGNIE